MNFNKLPEQKSLMDPFRWILLVMAINLCAGIGFWLWTPQYPEFPRAEILTSLSDMEAAAARPINPKDPSPWEAKEKAVKSINERLRQIKTIYPFGEVIPISDSILPQKTSAADYLRLRSACRLEMMEFNSRREYIASLPAETRHDAIFGYCLLVSINLGLAAYQIRQKKINLEELQSKGMEKSSLLEELDRLRAEHTEQIDKLRALESEVARYRYALTHESDESDYAQDGSGARSFTYVRARLYNAILEKIGREEIHILNLDLDHFKKVKQQYEGGTTDAIVKMVVERINGTISKETSFTGLFGGDEIHVYFLGVPYLEVVDTVRQIQQVVVEQPFEVGRHSIPVTFSAGLAALEQAPSFQEVRTALQNRNFQELDETNYFRPIQQLIDEFIRVSDKYGRDAKDQGRNQVIGAEGKIS